MLEQRRSQVTGAPIRVVQLPEVGILGGGGGLLGLPFEELVGARVLLLDETNDISSVYIAHDPGRLTRCYWDVVTVMDPLLPREGSLGFLGFGGGTAAVLAHKYWPDRDMEAWEYDKEVIEVARPHLGVAELEQAPTGALVVTCGDAFGARSAVEGGFAGLFVDLFAASHLLPQLEEEATWAAWLAALRPGGRLLANLGGGDPSDEEGMLKTRSAFVALAAACDLEMTVLEDDGTTMARNVMVLTGPPPDKGAWTQALPPELHHLTEGWVDPMHQ